MSIFKFVIRKLSCLLLAFITSYSYPQQLIIQPPVVKMITVRDGLPQSYVSGIFQDQNGFLWISTLNGLGRYDGREFKNYQHNSFSNEWQGDNNIIGLIPIGPGLLWLCYYDGRIDQFNTLTGGVDHLWQKKGFDVFKNEIHNLKTLIHDSALNCWMLANNGGIYRVDGRSHQVRHFSFSDLQLKGPVLGIAAQGKNIILVTADKLAECNSTGKLVKTIPYPFNAIKQFKTGVQNCYSPAIRKNGDLIITSATGLEIWNPVSGFFKNIKLGARESLGKLIAAFDSQGNYFFEFNSSIYQLRTDNSVVNWASASPSVKGMLTSMFIDRSGVLWVGTNGFGLRQYNLLKTGLPGYENQYSFVIDVLSHYGFSLSQLNNTFLKSSIAYATRSVVVNDSLWIADANRSQPNPQLVLCSGNNVAEKSFRNSGSPAKSEPHSIKFLAASKKGVLWAIDQRGTVLQFDRNKFTLRAFKSFIITPHEDINGMVADSGQSFYITTTDNFCKFNALTGSTTQLTSFLPTTDILCLSSDPDNEDILWIGTVSDGLIRYNKKTNAIYNFNTKNGLPNNTIYSILPGDDGLFWCSSNKGIFSFNRASHAIRFFTSNDGLTDDEFNRYFYMEFPGGNLAFGGPLGSTIFNPAKLQSDNFNPPVILTDLIVSNMAKMPAPLSTLTGLKLRYDQNFINVTFAAIQFDIPEKLRYRYMLKGLDKNWIMAGNQNRASYTSLPPSDYVLLLNATNTAGKWSNHIYRLKIAIAPPYWKTWWFYCTLLALTAAIVYLFFKSRIRNIKKAQAQKLHFEREAMELHAMALRARMNPHFIFNCLNSIKALIQEKHNQRAISYLTTFSTLIRKQLDNTHNEVTLIEELETCKLYLQLEAMRFDNRIDFAMDIAGDNELQNTIVPPLILQPVVENAVVHGLLPSDRHKHVGIKVYREGTFAVCEIEDNGIGRSAAALNKNRSNRLHESKGINLLEERIATDNRLDRHVYSMHTTDLFSSDGKPSGTLVTIKFNINI